MASIRFHKDRKQWEIRKHITNRRTKEVHKLCRLLPKGATQADAYAVGAEFEKVAFKIHMGQLDTAVTIKVAVKKWLLAEVQSFTDRTREHYVHVIERFVKALPSHVLTVDQIRPDHVSGYIQLILERSISRTGNAHLAPIKTFCRWFSRIYNLQNPADAVDFLREDPPDHRFLNQSEYDQIFAACRPGTADVLLFIANTGLRASELCGLLWSNIPADHSSLSIIGKGRKRRTIPLNQTCRAILEKIKPHGESPDSQVFPMNRRHLYFLCAEVYRQINIPPFGPHALRHWFATQLLLRGVTMAKVSFLMGHGSIKITERTYIHILPADMVGSTDVLDGKAAELPEPAWDGLSQIREIKKNHGADLFMIFTGGSYEAFYGDAERISDVIGLPVEHRQKNGADISVCVIPRVRLELILNRLVGEGLTVAVGEDFGGRDVIRVIRPGSAA